MKNDLRPIELPADFNGHLERLAEWAKNMLQEFASIETKYKPRIDELEKRCEALSRDKQVLAAEREELLIVNDKQNINIKKLRDKMESALKEKIDLERTAKDLRSECSQVANELQKVIDFLSFDSKNVPLTIHSSSFFLKRLRKRLVLASGDDAGNDEAAPVLSDDSKQQLKEFGKATRDGAKKSGDAVVPVKKLIDGLKKRAQMHGIGHAAMLYDDLCHMLRGVPEWEASIQALEAFFDEERKRDGGNVFNGYVGQVIGNVENMNK